MTSRIRDLAVGLLIGVLALTQEGCGYERKDIYSIEEIHPSRRERMEQEKRDLVKIEDLKIGNGPLAAWGRKISAHLRIDQADGTFIYEGPVFDLIGFDGFPESNKTDEHFLMGFNNPGVRLGLNGMEWLLVANAGSRWTGSWCVKILKRIVPIWGSVILLVERRSSSNGSSFKPPSQNPVSPFGSSPILETPICSSTLSRCSV